MRLADKAALIIMGCICAAGVPLDGIFVTVILTAVTFTCLSSFFAKPAFTCAVGLLWAAIAVFQPAAACFLSLFVYDLTGWLMEAKSAGAAGRVPAAVLVITAAVAAYCIFRGHITGIYLALFALAAAIAVILQMRNTSALRLAREIREIRDRAAEINMKLGRKNRELVESQDDKVKIATLTERGRIAREIHDSVGHILARSLLQTGAVMTINRDEAVTGALLGLKETLTAAMDSVRASVHDLREESMDLYAVVSDSLRDFRQYICDFQYDMGEDVPQNIKYCFAGVVREALSNTSRHSDATQIRIDMQEHPAFYRLTFSDNGTAGTAINGDTAGMGLENMRERTVSLGGSFRLRSDRGFEIHITVPKKRGEHE